MQPKAFAHRDRLAAVPTGFLEILKDATKDTGVVPEYMPLSLLATAAQLALKQTAPTTGVTGVFVRGTPQALSGAGAITVTEHKTDWSTTGADAGTLADGVQVGQLKLIQMVSDGGDGTLTPANFGDGTDITFADVGDCALLQWSGTAWDVLDLYNIVDGATAPVVA